MLYGYEQYYKAQNGSDIVLTLDATVQYYVEKALSEMVTSTEAQGATGIVMDVETGAVLAMASSPTYDLNDPSAVYESQACIPGEGRSSWIWRMPSCASGATGPSTTPMSPALPSRC